MFISNLHANNDTVVNSISACITRGYFLHINGKKYKTTAGTVAYLKSLIDEIRRVTNEFDNYTTLYSPYRRMNVEEYQRFIVAFYAVDIFNGRVLNTSARSLFMKPAREIPLFARDVSTALMKSVQNGGGNNENEEIELKYELGETEFDFTDLDETDKYEPGDHMWQYNHRE